MLSINVALGTWLPQFTRVLIRAEPMISDGDWLVREEFPDTTLPSYGLRNPTQKS